MLPGTHGESETSAAVDANIGFGRDGAWPMYKQTAPRTQKIPLSAQMAKC